MRRALVVLLFALACCGDDPDACDESCLAECAGSPTHDCEDACHAACDGPE